MDKIREYIGTEIQVEKVLVRDINKPRLAELDQRILTTDPRDILDNPDIDIVVELMGGIEPAFTYIKQAMGEPQTCSHCQQSRYGHTLQGTVRNGKGQ
ncbi:MAG: hypothetical protein ACOX1R_09780 [Caldicoprobacterales bacterium]